MAGAGAGEAGGGEAGAGGPAGRAANGAGLSDAAGAGTADEPGAAEATADAAELATEATGEPAEVAAEVAADGAELTAEEGWPGRPSWRRRDPAADVCVDVRGGSAAVAAWAGRENSSMTATIPAAASAACTAARAMRRTIGCTMSSSHSTRNRAARLPAGGGGKRACPHLLCGHHRTVPSPIGQEREATAQAPNGDAIAVRHKARPVRLIKSPYITKESGAHQGDH